MTPNDFLVQFKLLAGNSPFPWQAALYQRFITGDFPKSCNLPTGLGKTSVIAVWLIALANGANVPRRLVYVVNRRTVVDQTTFEVESYREKHEAAGVPPIALSTLRGQFADNREWSADPSKPAVICGTVDMIGSRLLFSGYGIGMKSKPLHAGFLGQDALLIHDEAHLEPAFQELIKSIEKEQDREPTVPWPKFRVMELTATSRGKGEVFPNEAEKKENDNHSTVQKRVNAKKAISLHAIADEKKIADDLAARVLRYKDSGRAILVFVRKVDDVLKIAAKLPTGHVQTLTGTMRGHERERLIQQDVFQRFLPGAVAKNETVYLVCTSAGEVGVNISADHLICDLSTFESMAQRFGRVNRFGDFNECEIQIVHPTKFEDKDYDQRREKTLALMEELEGDGSPNSLGSLDEFRRLAAFAPEPTILPVTDILFDAWALTSIKAKLPGRPKVEPYLHGISTWEPPETHVAWREEVELIRGKLLEEYDPEELLEQYPLKPHELLRDNSSRVFDRLKKLKAGKETPVWVIASDDTVEVWNLGELVDAGKETIERCTLLLPPSAGGLSEGMLSGDSTNADDVSEEWYADKERKQKRRIRLRENDAEFETKTKGMRLVLRIALSENQDDDAGEDESKVWYWYELPAGGDSDGSKSHKLPVTWQGHTDDVVNNAKAFLKNLVLPEGMKPALVLAAQWHDLGKKRKVFQSMLGNFSYPKRMLAKSGKRGGRIAEKYRHEFGSLSDLQAEPEFVSLSEEMRQLVLHVVATHHGRGRPHFTTEEAFDPHHADVSELAMSVPQRFAKLQRKYGRWGLAYLESLLRAADYAASAKPSESSFEQKEGIQ